MGREKWAEEQNTQIHEAMGQAYKAIFSQLSEDAEKQCVQVQARAAKRIDELQKTNHQMKKKNDELYRTIARKDRQLDAERVPDKDLVTDAEDWPFSLIDSVTTPTSSTGGGDDTSSLRWDGMNDDEENENLRRALFSKAYQIVKGGRSGYGLKK